MPELRLENRSRNHKSALFKFKNKDLAVKFIEEKILEE